MAKNKLVVDFELKNVTETQNTYYHLYLTNISNRVVNLFDTQLAKSGLSFNIEGSLSNETIKNLGYNSLAHKITPILPNQSIGITFNSPEHMDYWEKHNEKELALMGIVITGDELTPFNEGMIQQIKLEARKALAEAKKIDEEAFNGNLEASSTNTLNAAGIPTKSVDISSTEAKGSNWIKKLF